MVYGPVFGSVPTTPFSVLVTCAGDEVDDAVGDRPDGRPVVLEADAGQRRELRRRLVDAEAADVELAGDARDQHLVVTARWSYSRDRVSRTCSAAGDADRDVRACRPERCPRLVAVGLEDRSVMVAAAVPCPAR